MGNSYSYCTYHQRRRYPMNNYKDLEVDILYLIAQRKYEIKENTSDPDHAVNTILVYEEFCTTLRRGI